MEQLAQISMNIIQPVIKSNIQYVDSAEEFEQIELDCNQTILCFDNNRPCFYIRERNRYGEYSAVKVFFYEDFATKMQAGDNKAFYDKCKALKLDNLKTEIAYKFFIENAKPRDVWLWLLETKKADYSWDTVKHMRWKLKKALLSLETNS
jgi:hypothetical protein